MRWICTAAALLSLVAVAALAEEITFQGSWGDQGFNVISETPEGMEFVYSIHRLGVEELEVDGETMHQVGIPGVFLPNDAGAPNLPGAGRYIAIPEEASARVTVLGSRVEVFRDVNLAPAPPIPRDTDLSPPIYEKDWSIYGVDAYYPAEPVKLSRPMEMRGVDAVILGITPFQYNPVTQELVVYTDLRVRVEFVGGNGHFGDDRLRSRFWEPILQGHLVNYSSLPAVDFDDPARYTDGGYEYIIIVPDDPTFIAWGDTVKAWRKLQGITTEVFTTTELGGNTVQAIESFIDSAYANWDPAPAAFLLLSDYQNSGEAYGITSPMWNSYCRSDNMYADVDNDDLPDICHARICAQNEGHLSTMINKFLSYEREPYTDPGFYDHPLIACGWQTERWFQFCTEVAFGYFDIVQGKTPVHQYNVYIGNPSPGCEWSSNPNTYMVVAYFGTAGLGYIPDTNPHTYQYWDNGSAAGINAAINDGAFILQHRDHGGVTGWGEPDYDIGDLSGLTNEMYTFVFSINCLTGAYDGLQECFTEAFHRHQYGALGLIAASDVSYSFVNDTYVFGYYDLMWPDFMPDYPVYPSPPLWAHMDLMPSFGNVSGKYFLQQSSWPYNPSNKDETYHLFHMHGDAFTTLYSEVPQDLTVAHDQALIAGQDYFVVSADEASLIALTVDGEILGVAEGTGAPVTINIPPQMPPSEMLVTVTKFNHFRYEAYVPVIAPEGPYVILHQYLIDDSVGGNNDGQVDIGEPISLPAALRNVGVEVAADVDAVLETADPYVTISDDYEIFGDIDPDEIVWSPDDYDFEARAVCPDGHSVGFSITAEDVNDSSWTGVFNIPVHAPVISFYSYEIDDTGGGNGNGRLEPGETAELAMTLENAGSGFAASVGAALSTIDPYLTVVSGSASYGNIASGGTAVGTPAYVIEASASAPEGRLAQLDLVIGAQAGYVRYGACGVTIGGIYDDMEQGVGGWTHDIVTPGFVDQWHQSTELNHTPGGAVSWKCGDTGPGNYADLLDAGLVTPEITLPTNPMLMFWHWIDAEISSAYPGRAYDGGLVEIWDGTDWVQITPEGGYPYTSRGTTGPFPEYTPIYSGTYNWSRAVFDLSGYSGQAVQFRFRFGSDQAVNREGWYIDDLLIVGQPAVTVAIEGDAYEVPRGGTLGYTVTVENLSSSSVSFYGLVDAWMPSGIAFPGNPLVGPQGVTLGPGATQTVHLERTVPGMAPLGEYQIRVKVGNPPADLLDQDYFHFRVVP